MLCVDIKNFCSVLEYGLDWNVDYLIAINRYYIVVLGYYVPQAQSSLICDGVTHADLGISKSERDVVFNFVRA